MQGGVEGGVQDGPSARAGEPTAKVSAKNKATNVNENRIPRQREIPATDHPHIRRRTAVSAASSTEPEQH
jgi:hypothetical protein